MFAKLTFLVFGLVAGLVLIQTVHSDLQEVVHDAVEDQLNIRHKRAISPEFKEKHIFKQYKVEKRYKEQHGRFPTADEITDELTKQVEKSLCVYGSRAPKRLSVLIIKDKKEYRRLRDDGGVNKRTVQRDFHQGPVDVTLFETTDRYQVAHFQIFPNGRKKGPHPTLEKLEEGSVKVAYKVDGNGNVVGSARIGHFEGIENPSNLGRKWLEPQLVQQSSTSRTTSKGKGKQTVVKSSGPPSSSSGFSFSSSDFPPLPSRPSRPLARPSGGDRTSSRSRSLKRPQSLSRQNRNKSPSPVRPITGRDCTTSDGVSGSSGIQNQKRQNRKRSRSRDRSHTPHRAGKKSRKAGRGRG